MLADPRSATPRTDHVLADARLREASTRLGPSIVKAAVADALDHARGNGATAIDVASLALSALPQTASSLSPVVNATGVLVHTNLGRAPLSPAAREAVAVASGATDVELDLATGSRDRRGRAALAALAAAAPEAGDVHVVNNGAAALALVACALGRGGTVVVARGELVEIGDGFRIPALLESVGARIREVGTTNRVGLADYAAAVDADTAFVLKVHPSNFVVSGFTSSVPVAELATLPVPVVADIGSGLLRPHPRLPHEPDAATTLHAGAALVTASGDKLLGGPQCGLLLGEAVLVQSLRRHPLARALRVDKLTLAALEATLTGPPPPVVAALDVPVSVLRQRATDMSAQLAGIDVQVTDSTAVVGGGGAPGVGLPSAALALPSSLAASLRVGEPPVMGRVTDGRLLLDLFALDADDDAVVVEAVRRAAATSVSSSGSG